MPFTYGTYRYRGSKKRVAKIRATKRDVRLVAAIILMNLVFSAATIWLLIVHERAEQQGEHETVPVHKASKK